MSKNIASTAGITPEMIAAFLAEKAEKEGKGVIAVDGKMVDAPVVTRARHLVSLAEACGAERGASI